MASPAATEDALLRLERLLTRLEVEAQMLLDSVREARAILAELRRQA